MDRPPHPNPLPEGRGGTTVGAYAWYIAVLMALSHLVSFLDRFVMGLAAVPIKTELGLSDTQIGLLAGLGFVILYSVVAVPLGQLADVVNRKRMIAVGIFFWSVATAACAFADSFGSLFLARLSVGLGEASLVPAAMSLIAAYFTRDKLGRAVSLFTMGAGLGKSAAYIAGAAILAWSIPRGGLTVPGLGHFVPWQVLFLAASLPGFVLVVLMLTTVREPVRTRTGKRPGAGPALAYLRANLRVYLTFGIAAISVIMEVQTIAAWAPSFFAREHNMTAAEAGYLVGSAALLASIFGALSGGFLTDWMQSRGLIGAPSITMAVSLVATAVSGLVLYTTPSLAIAVPAYAIVQFMTSAGSPAGLAGIQMMTPPEYRGLISSIFLCGVTLIAVGLGPTFIGVLTDHVFTGPRGLGTALLAANLVFAVIGIVAALSCRRGFQALRVA
ncbi:MFS transporter [Rhodospirillales bacterium TMPK1]|uniref:MFS transporter n=2 Tax=Roseiterribacter gracilis TaxID=2812848 RepID=A0A8S8X9K0_9PROT|nr:MFS transporter [Rhodospirillales bacterium TMPK1]